MDTSPQKPFACKISEGCGMTFTNEDHLVVHEKKHEMVLNLELETKGANVFVADQTPTPTRLIKNCEEVGLFDDLKHVNPFDETFRRAVESKTNADHQNNGEISMENPSLLENPLLNNEDSLHTPQVFATATIEETREFRIEKQNVILSDNISFKTKKTEKRHNENDETKEKEIVIENKKRKLTKERNYKCGTRKTISKKASKISVNISEQEKNSGVSTPVATTLPILLPNAISVIHPQVIALGIPTVTAVTTVPTNRILLPKPTESTNQLPILQTTTATLPIKERLKEVLNNAKRNAKKIEKIEISTIRNEHHRTTEKNSKILLSKGNPNPIYDNDCMERRRAAAMRYRRKIKKEQADLKRRNSDLLAENSELKAIIKHLKQVLMAHQNCDIARSAHLGISSYPSL